MEIKIGQKVSIEAAHSARNRTKNRIREHGSQGFVVEKLSPSSPLFGGTPAVLLTSTTALSSDGSGGKEAWVGWLPAGEIVFI